MDTELSGAWELPEHFVMLRDTIRRFMIDEVRPVEERQPHDCYALPPTNSRHCEPRRRPWVCGAWPRPRNMAVVI